MIRVGSTAFFSNIDGFSSKDTDWVELIDNPTEFRYYLQLSGMNRCIFKWKRMTADEFVEYSLSKGHPMFIGKFLVPEFVKEIGFTINHLRKLKPIMDNIDEKHTYEKVIYDAYIDNNDFILTSEQLCEAYKVYKGTR